MCLLCADIQKDKLNIKEIARNYNELPLQDGHYIDVIALLIKEGLFNDVSKELIALHIEKDKL